MSRHKALKGIIQDSYYDEYFNEYGDEDEYGEEQPKVKKQKKKPNKQCMTKLRKRWYRTASE